MINRLKNSKAGFTIIELLIVMGIIGILSAIAIPNYLAYKAKAYDATALSDAKNCYIAIQAHLVDNPGVAITDIITVPVGFTPSPGVTLTVNAGVISSTHNNGSLNYTVAIDGSISSTAKA